jgi:hypothetical protein
MSLDAVQGEQQRAPLPGPHAIARIVRYDEVGWVAWCSCGIGSPAKRTYLAAERSTLRHVNHPSEYPR